MANILYQALLITPPRKKKTKLPKLSTANKAGKMQVIPGDDKRRCPTGVIDRDKLEDRVQNYLHRRDKSLLAQQGHNYKRMTQFLARLREIRDQKFPRTTVLYQAGPDPDKKQRWPRDLPTGFGVPVTIAATKDGIDWEKELARIDNRIVSMEERAHYQKKHGISIYNTDWATKITKMYLKAVRSALTRKGYQFHARVGSPDDRYSKHEKTWRFTNQASGDEIILAMLRNNAWVFDVFHNKTRTNYMIMNQSRAGQRSQGVPISMRIKTFAGVYSPSEARTYKSYWRKTMRWIYQL